MNDSIENRIIFLDSNIIKKINFSSYINTNSPFCLKNTKDIKPVSYFNQYDKVGENNYKYNGKTISKFKTSSENDKINNNSNDNIIEDNYKIFKKTENRGNHILVRKLNDYINISLDDELNLDKKIINKNFLSPKLIDFTNFTKALNNIKIKSTNFTSNLSYDNKENENENKNRKEKNISIIKNKNLNVKKFQINDNRLIKNNKNKQKYASQINRMMNSIHLSKAPKTNCEKKQIKKNKSSKKKSKNSRSKKNEKSQNFNNKNNYLNDTYKTEKRKPKNKHKDSNYNNDLINNENQTIRNEDKDLNIIGDDNKDKLKKSKSQTKVMRNKNIFQYFLCCFGCYK